MEPWGRSISTARSRRCTAGLFLDTSFDYTKRSDLRNNSASTSPLTQSDPIATGFYLDVYPTVPNRQSTSIWSYRLSSRYELPYDFGVAANFNVQSGWNYARRITVSLPNSGSQSFWMTNFDANRSETVPLLNLRLDKSFKFAGRKLTGQLDIFNILNNAAITNFVLNNGRTYNQVIQPLDPRTFQVGIHFDF